jgi:hypothetical protein
MRFSAFLIAAMLILLQWVSGQVMKPDAPVTSAPAMDHLAFLGHNGVNGAHLMDAHVVGDRAYILVGAYNGLETYDLSDPTAPIRIAKTGPAAWGAKQYGDRLYVFSRKDGFQIYDISGSTPAYLGEFDPVDPNTLFENGVLMGDTLYVAAHQMGIMVFDVTNETGPSFVQTIDLDENDCWDVEAAGAHLIVANGHFGLSAVQLGVPPVEAAVLPLPGLANHIVLDGDVGFLSLAGEGVATVDLSIPAAPAMMDRAPSGGNAFGSGIANHKVAVGSWNVLEVFDISDPHHIIRCGFENTKTWALGASIKTYGNNELIVVADWRGMSCYETAADPGPDIDVQPRDVDFGSVSGPRGKTVRVRNTGSAPLNVNVGSIPSGIDVTPRVFTVGPGQYDLVQVKAYGGGSLNDDIRFYSNDPDEANVQQFVYKNNIAFPQVGSPAPGFNLEDLDGHWHALSDYLGKVVYLEFGALW